MKARRVLLPALCGALIAACGACPASPPTPPKPPAAGEGSATSVSPKEAANSALDPLAAARKRPRKAIEGHPRIWLTAEDLPRLRSWARNDNPFWARGLKPLAKRAKGLMDAGKVPASDSGIAGWVEHPTEMFAAFFAFMSLVEPDARARADYAQRVRRLLMVVMKKVAQGGSGPFGARNFSTYDRSRYWGECFALTVDWIYPSLDAADKKIIHRVFSRWVDENSRATTTTNNHPQPRGLKNDPRLLANATRVRWSANNYYLAHMRNLALMGLAFDAADDPGGKLQSAFDDAVGAWLYVNDHFRRHDGRGGLSPEGPYYAPESVSYVIQTLLALYTSGRDDPARYGKQAAIAGQPYWRDILRAWMHLYPPAQRVRERWRGPLWEVAWAGDGSREFILDPIAIFGPLGLFHAAEGNTRSLATIRWMQQHFPTGGAEKLLARVARGEVMNASIFYFMLFAPGAATPRDPRPAFGATYLAEGTGQLFARTGWDKKARALRFFCGWLTVDHQHGEGNHFGFWRKGEWLTRDRTGYAEENPLSEYHNTLALECEKTRTSEPWVARHLKGGSQWPLIPAGDGKILRHSRGKGVFYARGDATQLYNSRHLGLKHVHRAVRDLVWLEPDHLVVLDRAETRRPGFKRFWMQLPGEPRIEGARAVARTKGGQQLAVTTLLPAGAKLSSSRSGGHPAPNALMTHRLRVEPSKSQAALYFLHLIQGADAKAGLSKSSAFVCEGSRCHGALIDTIAVVFAAGKVGALTFRAPGARRLVAVGLTPAGKYAVQRRGQHVTISSGGAQVADSAGVLELVLP